MAEPWMKWAVAEGGAKTAGRVLQKYLGVLARKLLVTTVRSFAGGLLVLCVIGAIQMIGGFFGAALRRKTILVSRMQALGAVCFGIIATIMTVLGLTSFTYLGADVGITTFIVTTSIIPGALIDWFFFGNHLTGRQWLGVGVFLLAGYAMLGFPPLETLAALPPWVWLTVGIAFFGAVNEGITQWQGRRKIDPLDHFTNNFWVGLTTLVCSGLGLTVLGQWGIVAELTRVFWNVSVAIGLVVLGMICFKLVTYQKGGSIALKKLIMQATYLITATILGWAVYTIILPFLPGWAEYAEAFTAGKLLGIAGYVVAFTLMDRGTWEFVSSRFLGKPVPAR